MDDCGRMLHIIYKGCKWLPLVDDCKMKPTKPPQICRNEKQNIMEALLIINSILVAVSLYFIKDFHKEFKEVTKKVEKLNHKLSLITMKLNEQIKTIKKKLKKLHK